MANDIVVNLTQMWVDNIQLTLDDLEEEEMIHYTTTAPRSLIEEEVLCSITSSYENNWDFNPFSVDYEDMIRTVCDFYGTWNA